MWVLMLILGLDNGTGRKVMVVVEGSDYGEKQCQIEFSSALRFVGLMSRTVH